MRAPLLFLLAAVSCALPDGGRNASSSCHEGDEAQQRRGTDCLCCHAEEFGISGTMALDAGNVRWVVVADSAGLTLRMGPNTFGNFFHHSRVTPPLRAWTLDGDGGVLSMMERQVDNASCNTCHHPQGAAGSLVRGY